MATGLDISKSIVLNLIYGNNGIYHILMSYASTFRQQLMLMTMMKLMMTLMTSQGRSNFQEVRMRINLDEE